MHASNASSSSSAPAADAEPLVRLGLHPTKGKVLLATRALRAGQVVLHEAPLIFFPGLPPQLGKMYRSFLAAPASVRSQVMEFWSPVDTPNAAVIRKIAAAEPTLRGDVETVVKLSAVIRLNAVQVRPEGNRPEGVGLFTTACRASHSCKPNCCWFSDREGWKVVKTLVPIQEGQEVTIDYKVKRFAFRTVCQRQEELLTKREFLCDCPRCTAHGDDMRCFPCSTRKCPGHHLVHQPTTAHRPEFTPCSACGALPAPAPAARMLEQEAELHKALDWIEAEVSNPDSSVNVVPTLLQLQPPHPRHAAAARLAVQRYHYFLVAGRWEDAAAAMEAVIEVEQAAVPSCLDRDTTTFEYLGDAILKAPRVTAAKIRQAEQAYRKAMQFTMLVWAVSSPAFHTLCAKLAAAQARLPAAEVAALASLEACSFCGGPRYDGKPLARCGRCRAAAYCCQEHQRAQWPLHKQHCRPAPPS